MRKSVTSSSVPKQAMLHYRSNILVLLVNIGGIVGRWTFHIRCHVRDPTFQKLAGIVVETRISTCDVA